MPISHKWHFFFTFYLHIRKIFTTFAAQTHAGVSAWTNQGEGADILIGVY